MRVRDPNADDPKALANWQHTLSELVMIQEGKVDLQEINIMTG